MANKVKFIGIKQLWYCDPLSEAVDETGISALVAGAKEIYNSHQDTFTYEQDDPETTNYINELTGKTYFVDKTSNGDCRINFTMGEYDFDIRAELEGGTVNGTGKTYAVPDTLEIIEKAVIALTRTGNYIVFTNASIVAKVDTQEKALGLGVTATAQDNSNDGVASIYFIDMSE